MTVRIIVISRFVVIRTSPILLRNHPSAVIHVNAKLVIPGSPTLLPHLQTIAARKHAIIPPPYHHRPDPQAPQPRTRHKQIPLESHVPIIRPPQLEIKLSHQRRQRQMDLAHGQMLPEARPRPLPERDQPAPQVLSPLPRLDPALRLERPRVREEASVVVDEGGLRGDGGAGWDGPVFVEEDLVGCAARGPLRDTVVEAECLVDAGGQVGELLELTPG